MIAMIAGAGLIVGACGGKTEVAVKTSPNQISNVATTKVSRSSIADFYEASGTVKAKTTTDVSANIMGRIVSFPVAEGDVVRKGELLVDIDDRQAAARIAKAEAGLKEAQASLLPAAGRSCRAARRSR